MFDDQTGAEPGWKGGEINGKCGWFPEAYVERVEESSQSVSQSADVTPGISTSEESSFISVPGKMPAVSPTPGQVKKMFFERIWKWIFSFYHLNVL